MWRVSCRRNPSGHHAGSRQLVVLTTIPMFAKQELLTKDLGFLLPIPIFHYVIHTKTQVTHPIKFFFWCCEKLHQAIQFLKSFITYNHIFMSRVDCIDDGDLELKTFLLTTQDRPKICSGDWAPALVTPCGFERKEEGRNCGSTATGTKGDTHHFILSQQLTRDLCQE